MSDPRSAVQHLRTAIAELRSALAAVDPTSMPGTECMRLASELATAEKASAGVRARCAARAALTGAPRSAGFRDPADWLAREAGSSRRDAEAALDVAASLPDLPATRAALDAGELSLAQAAEIANTAGAVTPEQRPAVEADLLTVARQHSLRGLRDRARRHRHAQLDPGELRRRQHAARFVRHWRDELGMVRIEAALPPEVGIPLVNRLDTATDRRMRAARHGEPERRDAHATDALVELLSSDGPSPRPGSRAELVVVVDLNAYRRGHAHPGEPCHIVGGGPIPAELAVELGRDAFLKAVLHDGVNVHTVKHFGRHIRAELRTALAVGAPPGFDGARCVEVGCDRSHHLEVDHRLPLATGGATELANLDLRCWPHHRDKSDGEQQRGLYTRPPPREQRS